MSATEKPYEAYVYAAREQVEQHIAGLDELSDLIHTRPLTFNERNAAERGLQVLVEMAIGCSKHLLKSSDNPVPSEAIHRESVRVAGNHASGHTGYARCGRYA